MCQHHNHACDHHDECHHEGHHDHHSHGGKLEKIAFILGFILYVVGLILAEGLLKNIVYVSALVFAGYHIVFEGISDTFKDSIAAKRFKPNVHLLMVVAAIGAIILKEYHEATLLIIIFAGAHFLESYAMSKSKKEMTALLDLSPKQARLVNDEQTEVIVDIVSLKIGDQLHVLNGDLVPIDGIITSGQATIDESSITGESIPVDKTVGNLVYGSTLNGHTSFYMEVTKEAHETVFSGVIKMVKAAQSNLSKKASVIKKIEPVYVTIVFLLTPLFYLLMKYAFYLSAGDSFYRSMIFLIGASPCALAVTDIPATLSALSNLSRRKLLFKGGIYLSLMADVKTIAFDKTGTLTNGKPVVTDLVFNHDIDKNKQKHYLDILLSMEKESNHPLAKAVMNHFPKFKTINLEVENLIGVGLKATYQNTCYRIGKIDQFIHVSDDLLESKKQLEVEGKTVICFGDETVYLMIALQDTLKASAFETIHYFNQKNIKTIMVTGDAKSTADALSKALKVHECISNVLPEDKAQVMIELKKTNEVVAFVGDGINDAPALAQSDIGISMSSGTDAANEASDAVLMNQDLSVIAKAHQVSLRLKKVVWQNIFFSLGVVVFLTVMNILGLSSMGISVLIHEGSTLVVILSGLRLLR